ncbi:MAG: SDR family NAD(P)-dependent oxidoreductase [Planctomycetes bacterium]|nr:SDR family NAD(P)-dependent oxidoreductase [Planctomycetota bacterium]
MNVLITGGAGFIGSHLAEALLNSGQEVVVVDNLSTGRLENIADFQGNISFEFYEADVRDESVLDGLVEKCDCVYHLAAAVGVQLIADRPVHTIKTNIEGTEIALELCNKYKRKIMIASSSEVYGKSEKIPFCENDDIVLGSTNLSRWSYACSKAIDEFLGLAFCDQYGLDVVICRFFNTIGPRQSGQYGMVVPRFVRQALTGAPVEIYGNGKQSRCFCYISDVIDAVVGLMNNGKSAGKVYNVGRNEEITIEKLADKIIKMTGSSSKKVFIPYERAYGKAIDDMMRRVPDVGRINKTIGWQAKTTLDDALQAIINSLK